MLNYIYINEGSSLTKRMTGNNNNAFVIYVGTPGKYQKLVILFFDKRVETGCVAKVPLTKLAKLSKKRI